MVKNISDTNPKTTSFALSSECLALLLSMTGEPEKGRAVLAAAHKELEQLDTDALLSSASHALLARGFARLDQGSKIIMDSVLEGALSCLNKFDQIVYLNVVTGSGPMDINLYARGERDFCAHVNKENLVHLLEYGKSRELSSYITSMLEGDALEGGLSEEKFETGISLLTLSALTSTRGQDNSLREQLRGSGWPESWADALLADLGAQRIRGTLLRTVTSSLEKADLETAKKSGLFFLRGSRHLWTFSFPTMEAAANGTARLSNGGEFDYSLKSLIQGRAS